MMNDEIQTLFQEQLEERGIRVSEAMLEQFETYYQRLIK